MRSPAARCICSDGCVRAACLCSASPISSGCRPNQYMQGKKRQAVGGARRSRPAARRKSPIAESAPARNFFRDAFSRRLICPVPMRVRVCATSQQWYRRPVLALQPDSMQMQGPPRCGNIGRSVGILPSSRGRPMRSSAAGEEAARDPRDPAQKDASGKKSQGAGRLGGGGPKPACRQEHPLSRWESQARDGCARAACLCSASPNSSGCRPNQCMQGKKCRAVGGARRSRPAARRKSPIAESARAPDFFPDAFFYAGSRAR